MVAFSGFTVPLTSPVWDSDFLEISQKLFDLRIRKWRRIGELGSPLKLESSYPFLSLLRPTFFVTEKQAKQILSHWDCEWMKPRLTVWNPWCYVCAAVFRHNVGDFKGQPCGPCGRFSDGEHGSVKPVPVELWTWENPQHTDFSASVPVILYIYTYIYITIYIYHTSYNAYNIYIYISSVLQAKSHPAPLCFQQNLKRPKLGVNPLASPPVDSDDSQEIRMML